MTAHSSFDTISLISRSSVNQTPWATIFVDKIYQILNACHPKMAIDQDAVTYIKDLISQLISLGLEQKCTNIIELDHFYTKMLPKRCEHFAREAYNQTINQPISIKKRFTSKPDLQSRMVSLVKESTGVRDKEKHVKEKELARMAQYLIAFGETITEDILNWTGDYVKNIRDIELKISLQHLKMTLSADKMLMDLNSFLNNEDDDDVYGGPLSFMHDYNENAAEEEAIQLPKDSTYESISSEFWQSEKSYLKELNKVNVFRRRLETKLSEEDRHFVKNLFGNFYDIHELTTKLERLLEDTNDVDTHCVGMVIWEMAEINEFESYLSYALRDREDLDEEQLITVTIHTVISELTGRSKFIKLFEEDTTSTILNGTTFRLALKYTLPDLLQLPILHFPKYLEFVNKLLRCSASDDDRSDLSNSKRYLTKLAQRLDNLCNQMMEIKEKMKIDSCKCESSTQQLKRLKNIEDSIDQFQGYPVGKTCRELLREGQLQMVRPSLQLPGETPTMKKGRWLTDRYIFLFDQLLIMCKKHRTDLKFKDRTAASLMDVVDIEDNHILTNAFRIDIREMGRDRSYTMICKSSDEKFSWMSQLVNVTTKSLIERLADVHEKEERRRNPLVIPGPEQYRFGEADSDDNILFEDYTTSSGQPVVKSGTVLKLVERLTYHRYADGKFMSTFLISYRSFCTPTELLDLLIERFNIPVPFKLQPQEMRSLSGGPLAGRYDTVQSHGLSFKPLYSPMHEESYKRFQKEYERPIQKRVLVALDNWIKNHWYDFDNNPEMVETVKKFLQISQESHGKLEKQTRKHCKTILARIDKQIAKSTTPSFDTTVPPSSHQHTAFDWENAQHIFAAQLVKSKYPDVLWHAAKKGDVTNYDILTLHPLEIGRQLTILHFDLYRAIKPIELVGGAWTKNDKHEKSPQLLRLTEHATLLAHWVSRSIVETESLEERVSIFHRVLEVMAVFEELHNFTGLVAFFSALQSASVHRLSWCWERLDQEKKKCYDRFHNLCDKRWKEMQKRIQSVNPPCIPFFGMYLTNIIFLEDANKTFVTSPSVNPREHHKTNSREEKRRILVSFFKCRRISDIIREIQMYQNQRYELTTEPSIRVLYSVMLAFDADYDTLPLLGFEQELPLCHISRSIPRRKLTDIMSKMKQFFESINPKSDFKNEDALQTYLYERSCMIEPKDTDKVPDVKPKRAAHVLKSPGIKPPKSNQYSASTSHNPSYSTQTSTVPNTPGHDSDGTRSALLTPPSDEMAIDAGTIHKYSSTMGDTLRRQTSATVQPKIGQLQPPPLHPRRARPSDVPIAKSAQSKHSAMTSPTTQAPPPPLFPRRVGPLSPTSIASTRSPPTPSSANRITSGEPSPTFVFPPPQIDAPSASSPPPALPPRRSAVAPATSSDSPAASTSKSSPTASSNGSEHLRVTLDRPSSEAQSPTVCLSVPLPPALPPRRQQFLAPPPLPPKPTRLSAGSVGSSSDSSSTKTPPPLPPKTYKSRKNSGSPNGRQ